MTAALLRLRPAFVSGVARPYGRLLATQAEAVVSPRVAALRQALERDALAAQEDKETSWIDDSLSLSPEPAKKSKVAKKVSASAARSSPSYRPYALLPPSRPAARSAPGLATGHPAWRGRLHAHSERAARGRPGDGVRGGAVPKHWRVLVLQGGRRHRHHHGAGRYVHSRLPFL